MIRPLAVPLFCTTLALCGARGAPLAEYRIFLDPGHGGMQGAGAVGPTGLREADVNWEVADRLRRLLVADGARVRLSHEDKDRQDKPYEEMPAVAQAWGADVYVSIHHNADAALRPFVNRTEVFYHVDDDGASADLARLVQDELEQVFGLAGSRPKSCFAYAVLRRAAMPAVLGEACHISCPDGERRLGDPAVLDAEAGAYHRALRRWLARGLPKVKQLAVLEHGGYLTVLADLSAPGGLDPGSVRLAVDGDALPFRCDLTAQRLEATTAAPLPAGTRTVTLRFRNASGNAARVTRRETVIPFRFARCDYTISPPAPVDRPGAYNRIRVTPLDRNGLPAPPHTRVFLTGKGDGGVTSLVPLKAVGGAWHAALSPDQRRGLRFDLVVESESGTIQQPLAWLAGTEGPLEARIGGRVRDLATGEPIAGAIGLLDSEPPRTVRTEPDGWYELDADGAAGHAIRWSAPGYRPGFSPRLPEVVGGASILDSELTPWFGGLLVGKTVVLDASDGPDPVGRANLRTARALADYLALAGAKAMMVRDSDDGLGEDERIARALAAPEAACVVLIAHSRPWTWAGDPADAAGSRGFWKWDAGETLARHLAEGCQSVLGTPAADRRLWDDWLLMHGHRDFCAAAISPLFVAGEEDRRRIGAPAHSRLAALGCLYGLLTYMADIQDQPAATASLCTLSVVVCDGGGAPPEDAVLVVDGLFIVPADLAGRCQARYLTPGDHEIVVQGRSGRVGPETVRVEGPETRIERILR